jgi:hypothetical protein
MITATKTKRVIIDYSQNQILEDRINSLGRYYAGMSNAEIVKFAIINFYNQIVPIVDLTESQEQSLASSISDKSPKIRLPKGTSASNFLINYKF